MKFFLKNHTLRHMNGRDCLVLGAAALLVLFMSGCGTGRTSCYQQIDTAMGTIVKETVYVKKGQEDITGEIRRGIVKLEEELLSRRVETAEIYEINRHAGKTRGMVVSEELWDILTQIQEVSAESDGALDITIGETVRLWDIDSYAADDKKQVVLPKQEQIEASLKSTGYEKVRLENGRIYLPQGMQLDLGAVGKGIACDQVLAYLQTQSQVTGAVISVGGSILTYGEKPDGAPWNIGIVDPQNTSSYIGGLTLEGQWCVSTSGDYERYVEVDSVRYHHIIDPATGCPADAGLSGVTVLSRSGMLSDALSTACFVLGMEKSLPLLERYGAQAVFVDHEGNITLSSGMEAYFQAAEMP